MDRAERRTDGDPTAPVVGNRAATLDYQSATVLRTTAPTSPWAIAAFALSIASTPCLFVANSLRGDGHDLPARFWVGGTLLPIAATGWQWRRPSWRSAGLP